jgi:hypothetical protein
MFNVLRDPADRKGSLVLDMTLMATVITIKCLGNGSMNIHNIIAVVEIGRAPFHDEPEIP